MNRLVAAATLCLFGNISSAAQVFVDRAVLMDFKGPVKTMTVIVTESSRLDSQAPPKQTSHQRFTFDEKARVIEEELFNSAGVLVNKEVLGYDVYGKKVSSRHFSGEGVLLFTTKYTYDSDGKLISWVQSNNAGLPMYKTERRYNDNGAVANTNRYKADGSVMSKEIRTYDSRNKITEIVAYGSDGQVSQRQTFGDDPNVIKLSRGNHVWRELRKPPVKEELDEHSNWQKRKQERVVNDSGQASELVEVIVRRFTYRR